MLSPLNDGNDWERHSMKLVHGKIVI